MRRALTKNRLRFERGDCWRRTGEFCSLPKVSDEEKTGCEHSLGHPMLSQTILQILDRVTLRSPYWALHSLYHSRDRYLAGFNMLYTVCQVCTSCSELAEYSSLVGMPLDGLDLPRGAETHPRTMSTMRAVLIKDGKGPIENLYVGDTERPVPKEGEVLIKARVPAVQSSSMTHRAVRLLRSA